MTTKFTGKRQYKNELKLICQWCEKRFDAMSFRMFCAHECKVEYYEHLDRHIWTEEEERFILGLVGLYPGREILRRVKVFLKVHVADSHIKQKVEVLTRQHGLTLSDRVDNFSICAWSKLLGGIHETRIHRWIKKGLKARRAGKEYMISQKDMIAFAKANTSAFQSIERQYLEWLFADELEWVDVVINAKPAKAPTRPVVCVTTNRRYSSLTQAEKDLGVSRDKIKRSLESGIPAVVGIKFLAFRYAD